MRGISDIIQFIMSYATYLTVEIKCNGPNLMSFVAYLDRSFN